MKTRVLLTNGKKTIALWWVEHRGTDVYTGPAGALGKRSYHASGQIHDTYSGERRNVANHVPLSELKGQFHLTSINIGNATQFVDLCSDQLLFSGRSSDAILMIDTRTIPPGAHTNISVGLVEPGNGAAIAWLLNLETDWGDEIQSTKQGLFVCSRNPWVYAMVSWTQPVAS
jgi:hypothetical protein